MKRKALFLDRDGVINIDYGYVHKVKAFKFIEGIFELTRLASSRDYVICVVTNQAGIARGYYSESDFKLLNNWMCNEFKLEGVTIDKVYYSPYHPVHGIGKYKKNHITRKPESGMFNQAISDFNIDAQASISIGYKVTDIQAGYSAGIGKNLYLGVEDISNKKGIGNYLNIRHLNEACEHL